MYYDILASSLIGSETQEEIDCVGFLRDTALSYLDDTDSPQFRTYHAENIKDVSKLDKAPLEVLQLLDQNESFTRSAVAKIGTLAKDFLIGLEKSILIGDKTIDIQAGIAAEVVITFLLNTEKLSEMSGLKYYSLWINKSRRYSSTDISK